MSVREKASSPRREIWTDQQRRAIDAREVSVALSAGAGCGKTSVLTERFLAHFQPLDPAALNPDQLGELVAITFTDRAAREMRDRIRRECYGRLKDTNPSDVAATTYWAKLLRSLDAARVGTIHSFCASLLRAHAVEAKIDPQFGVLEQSAADTLLSELIDDELRRLLSERDENVIGLLVTFRLDELRGMLADLATRRDRDQFARWLGTDLDKLLDAWAEFHANHVLAATARRVACCGAANRIRAVLQEPVSSHATMQARRLIVLELLDQLPKGEPARNLANDFQRLHEHAKVQGAGTVKQWFDPAAYQEFMSAAADLRETIAAARPLLEFNRESARPVAVASLAVLALAHQVAQEYARRKRELAMLDFDDLLVAAHQLLAAPDHASLRRRLSSQIRLLLVDEFQDTDRVQVGLIEALCESNVARGKLFFVGDHKQSIYRFRGAEPQVFAELQSRIPDRGRLQLSHNFRSQPAIVQFVNALFYQELNDYEPLIAVHQQVGPLPAIEFLWAPAEENEEGRSTAEDWRPREAEWITRRLRAMLDSREPRVWQPGPDGKPTARPVEPRDIAILFRAMGSVAEYEQELTRYQIPYYLVGGHAYYAQQEIFDLMNLLRSLVSTADSLSLAGALRSPFFSLADETLYWLAQHPEGLAAGLFAATLPAELPAAERNKVQLAASTILRLRAVKDRISIAALIHRALDLTGYDAALLVEFMGERKLANLRKLIEQARTFDRAGMFSLADFIEQLSNFVARQPKEPLAATHPEATDVVRLMSIHMAKGLEFPVVVVPDLARRLPPDRSRADFTAELGPMVKMQDEETGRRIVGGYELHAEVANQQDELETRRLLYVAATRAADYLLLSSGVEKLGATPTPWLELLNRRFNLLTGELRQPLPQGWPAPRILVTTSAPETAAQPANARSTRDVARMIAQTESIAAEQQGEIPAQTASFPPASAARRQFSFSRLTGRLKGDAPEDVAASSGDFVLPAPILDPLGLGTLVHAVLAEIDFAAHPNDPPGNVRRLVDRHADRHLEEPRGELEEATEMIERLLRSPTVLRLAAARETFTELEFLLGWPPGEFHEGGAYLCGFIDRLWQDAAGDWHVLDFKTNRVTAGDVASTAARYEMQMFVYALAVEQIFGRAPKSLTLHFLRTGNEQTFTWNLAARERVVTKVNDAIAIARTPKNHA